MYFRLSLICLMLATLVGGFWGCAKPEKKPSLLAALLPNADMVMHLNLESMRDTEIGKNIADLPGGSTQFYHVPIFNGSILRKHAGLTPRNFAEVFVCVSNLEAHAKGKWEEVFYSVAFRLNRGLKPRQLESVLKEVKEPTFRNNLNIGLHNGYTFIRTFLNKEGNNVPIAFALIDLEDSAYVFIGYPDNVKKALDNAYADFALPPNIQRARSALMPQAQGWLAVSLSPLLRSAFSGMVQGMGEQFQELSNVEGMHSFGLSIYASDKYTFQLAGAFDTEEQASEMSSFVLQYSYMVYGGMLAEALGGEIPTFLASYQANPRGRIGEVRMSLTAEEWTKYVVERLHSD